MIINDHSNPQNRPRLFKYMSDFFIASATFGNESSDVAFEMRWGAPIPWAFFKWVIAFPVEPLLSATDSPQDSCRQIQISFWVDSFLNLDPYSQIRERRALCFGAFIKVKPDRRTSSIVGIVDTWEINSEMRGTSTRLYKDRERSYFSRFKQMDWIGFIVRKVKKIPLGGSFQNNSNPETQHTWKTFWITDPYQRIKDAGPAIDVHIFWPSRKKRPLLRIAQSVKRSELTWGNVMSKLMLRGIRKLLIPLLMLLPSRTFLKAALGLERVQQRLSLKSRCTRGVKSVELLKLHH